MSNEPIPFSAGIASLKRVRADLEWLARSLVEADPVDDKDLERLGRVNSCVQAINTLCDWPWAMKLCSFLEENEFPKSTYHHMKKNGLLPPPPIIKFGRTSFIMLGEAYPWLWSMEPVALAVAKTRADNDDDDDKEE